MRSARNAWYWVAATLLVSVTMFRLIELLAFEPLVGLANSYDMIRVQACIDAYPVRDASIPPTSHSWQAPVPSYRFRQDVEAPCFLSSESWLAVAYAPLLRFAASQEGEFPLRVVGIVKGSLLLVLMLGVLFTLSRSSEPGMSPLGWSLFCALLLMDPGVTLYLNGFYAEFAAVLFGVGAVTTVWMALRSTKPSYGLVLLSALLVSCATLSKLQHVIFGCWWPPPWASR